jgi:hypothetical protein
MVQAWPRRLNENQIWENYKHVTDYKGRPNIPDGHTTFKSFWHELYKVMCEAGFCPNKGKNKAGGSGGPGGMEYVDYEYA